MFRLLFIFLLCTVTASAQTHSLYGKLTGNEAMPVAGASISVNGVLTTQTDSAGSFSIPVKERQTLHLHIVATSYKILDTTLRAGQWAVGKIIQISLQPDVNQLTTVEVTQRMEVAALRQSMQQVTAIDVKKYYNKPSAVIDVLGQASGIRIRQDGGLGSRADFAINGISGKQVRTFIDGIPANYFGAGTGLNTLPVNVVDRIEIYKGVVPVFLGADALGGAINIITRKQAGNYLEASYAISSFNTHRATANAQVKLRNNAFIATSLYYNYSDNNYTIDAEVPNQFGNPVPQKVKRFHDRFSSRYAAVELGVQDKKWADLASISVSYSGINQQVQHNVVMTQPYGKVTYGEETLNAYIKYNKHAVLPGLSFSFFGGAGNTKGHFLDTSLNAYAWDGTIVNRRTYGGEIAASRNDLYMNTWNTVGRFTATYAPDSITQLTFNITATYFERKGKDTVAAAYYGQDYFTSPTKMIKPVIGLSLERSLIKQKLTSLTALKYYAYRADGYVVANNTLSTVTAKDAQWGAAQSFRYIFSSSLLAKFSYEYAVRLPDEVEAFGDFVLTRANPGLTPERSHNVNLGMQYRSRRFRAEVTGFYRYVDNIIYLRASQFFAQYQNLLKAQVTGVEGEVNWQPKPYLQLMLNSTYQNVVNKSLGASSGTTDDRYYNLRLPNIPYFFSNGSIQFNVPDFLKKANTLSAWYTASHVQQFYLYWAIDGRPDQKATIPSQFIQNAGLSYSLLHNRYSMSFETQNLADAKAYDNFSVQKPGRSFHFKLKFFIQ